MSEQGTAFWQDRKWWRKNAVAIFFVVIFLGGAVTGAAALIGNVSDNTVVLKDVEVRVDTLAKKHTILNHSFTSFRMSIEEDISDLEESVAGMAEEQSETHDLTIRIAERLGVD